MKFSYQILYISFLLLLVLFNVFTLFGIEGIFREIYTLFFLFFVPGSLILSSFRFKANNTWYFLVNSLGLSITTLLFGGLFINFLLPLFSILKPLQINSIILFIDITLLPIIIFNYFHKYNDSFILPKIDLNKYDIIFILSSAILPVLSVSGSISLNNNGSNLLTIILLSIIPLILLFLILLRDKLNESVYYYFILFSSISLLLMLSLRSYHIVGSDINDEYRIFQLTKNLNYWNFNYKDVYNACLSLTILPTIISNITHINDEYIYKVVIQLLFSFSPIGLYLLYRNFTSKELSLLGVFYLIAQPFFIQPMTGLIRQEVALFFFVLILVNIFNPTIKKINANILFIIFGISMVVSHYSTSYIAVGLFTGSYIFIGLYREIKDHSFIQKVYNSIKTLRFNIQISHTVQAVPLLILIIFTYFWYFQFTNTSVNIITALGSSLTHINKIFDIDNQNDQNKQIFSVLGSANLNTINNINSYVKITTDSFIHSKIPIYHVKSDVTPINDLTIKPNIDIEMANSANIFFSLIKLIAKVIIFLSPILLIFKYLKKENLDNEYIIFTIFGLIFVALIIISPSLSADYNLSRIYLQVLMIAAIGGVLFLYDLMFKLSVKIKLISITLLFVFMFILYSGLTAQFLGGVPYLQLNNLGSDYDKFYVHQQEVNAALWMSKNYDHRDFIFTDNISNLRLFSFANITTAIPILLPSAMYENSYVYVRYANIKRLRTDAYLNGNAIIYSFPVNFLNTNKNLIYNNGGSEIYR